MYKTINHFNILLYEHHKVLYYSKDDNKLGVSQGDLYQIVAYAIRRKADSMS